MNRVFYFVMLLAGRSPKTSLFILHLESSASFPVFTNDKVVDCRFATGLLQDC